MNIIIRFVKYVKIINIFFLTYELICPNVILCVVVIDCSLYVSRQVVFTENMFISRIKFHLPTRIFCAKLRVYIGFTKICECACSFHTKHFFGQKKFHVLYQSIGWEIQHIRYFYRGHFRQFENSYKKQLPEKKTRRKGS